MDIKAIRNDRNSWFDWKNIAPINKIVSDVKNIEVKNIKIHNDDWFSAGCADNFSSEENSLILECAKQLIPWRKGPFKVSGIEIDSEWQSNIKYNIIKEHLNIEGKIVADVGCNNGYYMFRMLEKKPKKLVGFDPSPLFKLQFDFVNHFAKSDIVYELLGVEHIEYYEHKFDFIVMMGVLYHRTDPIATLKSLNRALNKNGEILIDTFMIDGDEDMVLTPKDRYSKIPNVYFVPTVNALKNWLGRAGFGDFELIDIKKTDAKEQRKTAWSTEQSLEDFLDPNDETKTIEGYQAPKRVYIKAYKISK
ncbi:MAG: tRNA 5-methoxyuridine(34)/uridine 5-oxyacetic acid(34) synthase CmoB [Campylobacterota bacterium]